MKVPGCSDSDPDALDLVPWLPGEGCWLLGFASWLPGFGALNLFLGLCSMVA